MILRQTRVPAFLSAVLLSATIAVTIGAVSTGPATAAAKKPAGKSVNLTITTAPPVTLKGTKGECTIDKTSYSIQLDGTDYPSLGTEGFFALEGPVQGSPTGSAATTQASGAIHVSHPEVKAVIGGVQFGSDAPLVNNANDFSKLDGSVTTNVKKKTITLNALPIIGGNDLHATVTGVIRCK